MILRPEPLTAAAFAPFGEVIAADPARAVTINEGFTTRFHALARVETDPERTRGAILSIFRGRPRPLEIALLERHPLGSQAFMPLGGRDWLTVVAERPEPAALRAFLCRGDQGVNLCRGCWHHPLLVLDAAQDFLVVDADAGAENLDEVRFDSPVRVVID